MRTRHLKMAMVCAPAMEKCVNKAIDTVAAKLGSVWVKDDREML